MKILTENFSVIGQVISFAMFWLVDFLFSINTMKKIKILLKGGTNNCVIIKLAPGSIESPFSVLTWQKDDILGFTDCHLLAEVMLWGVGPGENYIWNFDIIIWAGPLALLSHNYTILSCILSFHPSVTLFMFKSNQHRICDRILKKEIFMCHTQR